MLAHRLFPAVTALWFAALFGLGGLVAGGESLAALVAHLHLAAIIPAAAPPLGMTARLLVVLALAGLGGGTGLVCGLVLHARARPIAATPVQPAAVEPEPQPVPVPQADQVQRVRQRDAHPDAPPRRPLVVTEHVLPYPTAVGEPQSTFRPISRDAEVASFDMPGFLAAAFAAADHDPAEPEAVEAPEAPVVAQAHRPPLASQAAATPHAPLADAALDSLGLVQLIERLALAIARRQARLAHSPTSAVLPVDDRLDQAAPSQRFDPMTMDAPGPLLRAKRPRFDAANPPEANAVADSGARLHDPLSEIADWAEPDHDLPRFLGSQPAADDQAEQADPAMVQHRYSSLADLAMLRPALVPPEILAADHLPDVEHRVAASQGPDAVVRFPQRFAGQNAHETDPKDADHALREALATLRRMSAGR